MVPPDCQLDARVHELVFRGSVLGCSYCALYDDWSVAVGGEEGPGLRLRPVYQSVDFEPADVREGMYTVAGVPAFALGVVPSYSGCIHSAWAVVEELGRWGYRFELRRVICNGQVWLAWFGDCDTLYESGLSESAPVAICTAAVRVARRLADQKAVAGVN